LNPFRKAAAWYARLPAVGAWAVSLAILFVGILLLGFLQDSDANPKAQSLQSAWAQAPWVVIASVALVPILETLAFQTLFLDGFARLTRARWPWVIVSALTFSVGVHYRAGWFPMLVSAWVGLVFSATYLGQRDRSFARAFAVTACLQVTFGVIGVAGTILVL
jgi:hypothetical protein